MRRHGSGHGTRMPRGIFSGTTIATIPSGVTIDANGVNSGGYFPLQMGAFGGTQLTATGGYTAWTGATQNLVHGFSTVNYLNLTLVLSTNSGASVASDYSPRIFQNTVATGVSYTFRAGLAAPAIIGAGGTVTWLAIGS